VEAIAFAALDHLLRQPGSLAAFRRRRPIGWLARLLARFSRSEHDRLARVLARRDTSAFRLLDFNKFTGYVCDRFLSEPGNPLHRHVLRVLLCYLFPPERELVLHWLRGRPVQGYFARKFGVEEELDRTYKRMDAVRLLISLFSPEVSRGLGDAAGLPAQVVFLAFDQTEGRDELFDSDDDWFKFFAHLSELYNSLPNVLILFTMTLGLRDRLHGKLEKQFQDRIRREERFVLHEIEDSEVLSLYRRRLDRWLGLKEEELRGLLAVPGNAYLPFEQKEVLELAGQKTLRDMLAAFDAAFRARLLNLITEDIRRDYLLWLRELRTTLLGDPHKDTEGHLETVEQILAHLGETFAAGFGLQLLGVTWQQTQDKLNVLEVKFTDPANISRWVRVYIARFSGHYTAKVEGCVQMLANKARNRNFLWLVRAKPIDPEVVQYKPNQIFLHVLPTETETTLKAMLRVLAHRDEYKPDVWQAGEPFLLAESRKTYLGELFQQARDAVTNLAGGEAAEEESPSAASPQT
jgi:hypothetical protein